MSAPRHQFVIGRMKLDLVAAVAPGIEAPQLWRVLIRSAAARGHRSRPPVLAELREFLRRGGCAVGGNRFRKRRVEREQIDVLERRRLVEDFVGCAGGSEKDSKRDKQAPNLRP